MAFSGAKWRKDPVEKRKWFTIIGKTVDLIIGYIF